MIRQLAHICIRTTDLALTERYYSQALGLAIGFRFEKEGKLFGYYINVGNTTFIEVFEGDPGEVGNINHVSLQVDDLDELINHIRQAGFEVGDKKMGADNSWQAWATDPNGIRIEFHQYTPTSMQLIGGTCLVNW